MNKLRDFELRTEPGLRRWYDQSARSMGFRAKSPAEAEAWQLALRDKVIECLGSKPTETCDLDAHPIESIQAQGYTRELVVIQTQPGEYMPVYVLIPQGVSAPYRPVIALHGHEVWGADGIVGIRERADGSPNNDYARQLALHGFLVFVPFLRGFAQRLEASSPPYDKLSPEDQRMKNSCQQLSLHAIASGKTLLGMRVWDVMRLIDYIHTRPEPMTESLGCVGLSGGGTVTLFTTALDSRITCAVVSGYFNTFHDSIMSIDHCACNFVPGILRYAEMVDLAGLVAPRPLLVASGTHDHIFPVSATQQALSELRPIYATFDAASHLDADIFEGEHQWSGAQAYDWLGRWL